MDLRSVDLNLLIVLDALLQEAHVSRAARRVGLSQPATSSALERCRKQFDDPLLLRRGKVMALTPKALRLREELQPVLASLRAVFEVDNHPLAETRQNLRISLSDTLLVRVASRLIQNLAEAAPGVNLVFAAWFGPGRALENLASGDIDLAVSQFPDAGASFVTRVIGRESYRVVMRKDHPAAAAFNLDAWLAYPHIMVSGRGENYSSVDRSLQAIGRERRVGVVVPSFVVVPQLLLESNLVATLPEASLADHERKQMAVFNPPLDLPDYDLHIARHRRVQDDPLIRHVESFLTEAFASQ